MGRWKVLGVTVGEFTTLNAAKLTLKIGKMFNFMFIHTPLGG